MPRGKKALSDYDKANVEKVQKAEFAKGLLEIVEGINKNLEKEILSQLRTQPAQDLVFIKAKYEVVNEVIGEIKKLIAEGQIAEHRLNKSDEK